MSKGVKYLGILAVLTAAWNTDFIKPLRIFAVFLHELGHSLMAFVFGKGIESFMVSYNESGFVTAQTKGWFSNFAICNGGYLGNLLFALFILKIKDTKWGRFVPGILAILLLGVSIKFSGFSFTLLYSCLFAAFVILLYMLQKEELYGWVMDVIGISSLAYAFYDIFVDTILYEVNKYWHFAGGWRQGEPVTDAVLLWQITGIPAIAWGMIWLLIGIISVNAVLLEPMRRRRR